MLLGEDGRSKLQLEVLPEHLNGWGAVHGGVTMTALDVAMAVAARSLEPTIDAAIDAVRGEGAVSAFVSGSGPTVLGLFPTLQGARLAVDRLNAAGVDAKAARAIHNQSSP